MVKKSLFDELYSKLNIEQKKAVDTIEGPVMVVAGPGTGKTQILILRIAKILKETDIEPENILALTFTEAASNEMRERLVQIMGTDAYRIGIFTFHGFCNDIIQRNPDDFPDIIGGVPITESEQVEKVKKILENPDFTLLRPFGNPSYYVRPLLRRVSDIKRAGIGIKEFAEHIAEQEKEFKRLTKDTEKTGKEEALERQINRNKELVLFYERYQEMLRDSLLYDYDDMILKTVEALSGKGELLISLQEQYLYLLADEHQDVNHAQNMVLDLLSSFHKSPNLFIVGDEKQAIFRFQGASLENFRYFQEKHPDAKLIRLKQNYRSTQNILDGAQHMMSQSSGSLNSNTSKGEKIEVFEFSSIDVEIFFVSQQIKELQRKGVKPSDIAILVRDNKDASPVVHMLEKHGIPFILEAEHDVLGDEDIKKLLTLFYAIEEYGSDELLFRVLHLDFLDIDPLLVLQQVRRAKDSRMSLTESIRLEKGTPFSDISKKMARWHIMAKNQSGLSVFESIVRESGFLSYLLSKSNSHVQIEKLRGLHQEMRLLSDTFQKSSLCDFLSHLDTMKENGVSLRKNIKIPTREGVRVMTAHKAKGREFSYVFLVNAHDGHWGNRKIRQTFLLPERIALSTDSVSLEDEEERKLFYVALTRAKKKVFISYAKTGLDGRSFLPSRFISEIAEKFQIKGDTSKYEKTFTSNKDIIFAPVKTKHPGYREKEFVSELFHQRGLSVSALNNYLSCPWRYFYINLVQIPKSPNRSQLYGTAVHNALADFFDELAKEGKASKTYLLSRLKIHALRLFGKEDAREVTMRGSKALSGYYDTYKKSFHTEVLNELSIQDVVLNDVRLTGKLDKVELGENNEVNVVDYKTGRVRSRNDIEGKTKTSNGDYKRQLVFYKLLLDSHKKGKYKMKTGELDFVEPSPRGKYKKEKFVISNEDVEELKKIINRVAKEITGLKFYKTRCDDALCEFCTLR